MNISQPRERPRNQPNQTAADGRQTFGLRINGVSTGGAGAPEDNPMNRAQRFEDEKQRIIVSCFSKRDETGSLLESYITHIRVTEDAAYPSSPPPPDSSLEHKKPRVIIVAVRKSGRVRMHKARENANGSFSIGKTWPLDDLSSIQSFPAPNTSTPEEEEPRRWAGNVGFMVTIGKPYFWQADTLREKEFFIASLVKIYRKYTGGRVPSLIGFDPRETQQLLGIPTRPSDTATSQVRSLGEPTSPLTTTAPGAGNQQSVSDPLQRSPNSIRTGPSPSPSYSSQSASRQPSDGRIPSMDDGSTSRSVNGSITEKTSSQTSLPLRSAVGTPSNQVADDGRGRPRPEAGSWASKGIGGSPGRQHQSSPQRPPFASRSSNDGNMGRASPTGRGKSSSRTTPNASQTDIRSSSRDNILSQSATSSTRPSIEDRQPSSSHEKMIIREENKVLVDSIRGRESPKLEKLPMPGGWAATPDISDKNSFISGGSDRGISTPPPPPPPPASLAPSTGPTAPTSSQPPGEPPTETNNEEEIHRPGLGPMIKKKTTRDVATTFRKAATAYNAFKPRVGGAGDRLKEKEEERRPGEEEPDGINGVVPAPSTLARGRGSHDKEMMNETQSRLSISSTQSIEDDHGRRDTGDTKSKQEDPTQVPSAPPVPSKPSESQEEQAQPQPPNIETETELTRLANALDISPSILLSDPRITQIHNTFTSTLREFSFEPSSSAFHTQNISAVEAGLKKEIARVEAGSWLLNLEENNARVEEVENLLDKAIAECDVLDGLLSLYGAELNTLSEDVKYIESQSQGLAIGMANRQALKGELERTLREDRGVNVGTSTTSTDTMNKTSMMGPPTSSGLGIGTTTSTGLSSVTEMGSAGSNPTPNLASSSSSSGGMGIATAAAAGRYGGGPRKQQGYFQQQQQQQQQQQNPSSTSSSIIPPSNTTIPFSSSSSSSNPTTTYTSSLASRSIPSSSTMTSFSARDTERRLMERRQRWEGGGR